MSVHVCNSPSFEAPSEQSSYFNLHMPGKYRQNAGDKPPDYFDLKPRSPAETPYYDAGKSQSPGPTPFFDCETMSTPFFEQIQRQHGLRLGNDGETDTNNNNNTNQPNLNANVGTDPFMSANPGISIPRPPLSFQDGIVVPAWLKQGTPGVFNTLPKSRSLRESGKGKTKPSLASLSPFTAACQSLDVFSSDALADLIKRKDQSQSVLLLLDLRSFSLFTECRIKNSLNICVPTTLLKRGSFTADKIVDMLVSDYDKEVFKEWTNFENIVLYDEETDVLFENTPIFYICQKFKSPNCKAKIGWLKGGFAVFSQRHADLCERAVMTPNSNPPASSTFPRRRISMSLSAHKSGPFTCPTPIVEIAGVNPFFSNIRQNYELSVGITETIPIRLPEAVAIDWLQMPQFIRELVQDNHGKMKLAERFQEIERAEQERLQALMLRHSNQTNSENKFSITAGMEKGTKNRYVNIWPYDHSRVKLDGCKEGECDYVNASLVQADGCGKSYIATQGPLPATYEDFWRVVWEQNSRVIVMLTKEEEAGRIQCHRYWAECTTATCHYGPLNLRLLAESTPFFGKDGEANSAIVARRFSLDHSHYPDVPSREITQLHFLGWPDFGVPDSPCYLLQLINAANCAQDEARRECTTQLLGPMIIHCSAGCGRTGAFCTVDTMLSLLADSPKSLDCAQDLIQATVLRFREQRLSMVQTLRQYVFCYEAVLWKLVGAA